MTTATTVVPVPVRKHGRLRTPLAVGLPLLALAGASVGIAVALADDDAAPARAAAPPAIAIAQSPDAAERWLTAESPTIQSGSPDALERRLTPASSQAGTERGREADAARLQAQADAYLAASGIRPAIAQAPDAAERWLTAESPTIQSGSPDALERRLTPASSQAGTERGREADAARLQAQADAYLAAQLEP